ncbi:MAG: hypothetical protein QOE90_3500 [Thermoplasmata archaeon]|nr:hypothetical protein [Thermoplasmata archaeon]
MVLEELPDEGLWRPKATGLEHERADGSARGMWRKLHQIYEEMGYDLAAFRATSEGKSPWDVEEPPWEKIRVWAGSPTNRAIRVEYQQLLRWLCAHWGLDRATMPEKLSTSWRNPELLQKARNTGLTASRSFHFVPDQIRTLLSVPAFTLRLRLEPRHWAREDQRQIAAYKDDMCHAMIFHGAYLGYRRTEHAMVHVRHYDRDEKCMSELPQEKNKPPRNPATPEKEVFAGSKHAYPSLEWWLDQRHPCPENPDARLWPQIDGTPYKNVESVLGDFINLVLGPQSPSVHDLRGFAATWAHHHGWTDDAVAKLLDDEWKNVTGSYLNHAWLDNHDRLNPNTRNPRPARELLRSNGQRSLHQGHDKPRLTGSPNLLATP